MGASSTNFMTDSTIIFSGLINVTEENPGIKYRIYCRQVPGG
jgi:hypothetical protein